MIVLALLALFLVCFFCFIRLIQRNILGKFSCALTGDGETISFIAGCDQSLTVGCTDPESSNYDENAIINDGSCEQLGINELIERISIYPNPASDNILINYVGVEVTSIKIIDMTGREVLTNSLNKQEKKIYLNGLESGTYFVKFNSINGKHFIKTLIIL